MFIFLPISVDYRARRYPVATFTLMGICTAVYLATLACRLSNGEDAELWTLENLWLIPEVSHWWTYLTSMFVHAGLFHLLGNMVFLFLFGSCVEDIIGRARFTIFYLLCGLLAEFAYIGLTPEHFDSPIPMGGASGAISGCMGGFMLLLLKTRVDFKYFGWFFFRIFSGDFSLPSWVVVSAWFAKDVLGLIVSLGDPTAQGGVAFGAHIGGTLCGLGLIALEKLRTQRAASAPARAPQARAVVELQDIYLYMNDAQHGPYKPSQIQSMLAAEALAAGTLYWKDGMADWRPVEEMQL